MDDIIKGIKYVSAKLIIKKPEFRISIIDKLPKIQRFARQGIHINRKKQCGSPKNSPQGIQMDVLWTKNSRIRTFSIEIQVLTDCFLNRTQVNRLKSVDFSRRIFFISVEIVFIPTGPFWV
jgi:hypothetical protein